MNITIASRIVCECGYLAANALEIVRHIRDRHPAEWAELSSENLAQAQADNLPYCPKG